VSELIIKTETKNRFCLEIDMDCMPQNGLFLMEVYKFYKTVGDEELENLYTEYGGYETHGGNCE